MSTRRKLFGNGRHLGWAFDRLAGWILAIGDRLFVDEDVWARAKGLQVEVRLGGLGRTYRDPRFDSLAGCPVCRGIGSDQDIRCCDHCSGTSRIRLDAPLTRDAGVAR